MKFCNQFRREKIDSRHELKLIGQPNRTNKFYFGSTEWSRKVEIQKDPQAGYEYLVEAARQIQIPAAFFKQTKRGGMR